MFCNKYLEEFKIDLVKQYFSGRPNKDICDDYKIARSTLWSWIYKYGHMIQKDWKVSGVGSVDVDRDNIKTTKKGKIRFTNLGNIL